MRFSQFVANRIGSGSRSNSTATRWIVGLAVVSVGLGIVVMLVSLSIVHGFERAVSEKIAGFAAHVQIGAYMPELDDSLRPLSAKDSIAAIIRAKLVEMDNVPLSIEAFIQKPALLQSDSGLEGIVLKGVPKNWETGFFKQALVSGVLPAYPDSGIGYGVLISKQLGQLLSVQPGARVSVYFLGDRIRARRVEITGFYETGLEEFDKLLVICDNRLLQRILNWEADQIEGYEVRLKDINSAPGTARLLDPVLPYYTRARAIQEIYPELFDWLRLTYQNVWFILTLMTLIAIINMITVMLILIIERTTMIGLLKALGASNWQIGGIFWWLVLRLAGNGIIGGNMVAISLLALQYYTGWMQLDQQAYFVRTVPVAWEWSVFLLLNIVVVAVLAVVLLIPMLVIIKIRTIQALRLE